VLAQGGGGGRRNEVFQGGTKPS